MALAGVLLLLSPHVEAGDTCADPRVSVQGELDPRWLAPIVDLCESLGQLPDLDPSATLRIVPRGTDVILDVRLADGRTALRRLKSPDDLRLTVEALMTVPPEPVKDQAADSPQPSPPPISAAELPPEAPPAPPPAPSGAELGVEWGALLDGRVARAPTYLSLGPAGHFSLRSGGWLLSISARWDAYDRLAGGAPQTFETESFAAGFGAARRVLDADSLRLDVGPNLLLVNEAQSMESTDGEHSGSVTDVRFGALFRCWLGSGRLRFLGQVDAEVSPTRLRRDIRVDSALPALPSWSIGLGLGVGWSAP